MLQQSRDALHESFFNLQRFTFDEEWVKHKVARADFRLIRFLAGCVNRFLGKGVARDQPGGVLSRIQVGVVLRPVEVYDLTRMGGGEDRCAELAGKIIKLRQVPVGVGHAQRGRCHACGKFGRNMRATVGNRQQ